MNINNNMLQKLHWQIVRFVARTNVATKFATVLLIGLLLLYFFAYRPQAAVLQHLIAEQTVASANHADIQPESALSAYLMTFPKIDARAAKINTLMDIANQQHVLLDEVRYNVDATSSENAKPIFSPYHVEFSVFATYPEIHQFLSQVLIKMPYVALERLDLSREDVQEEVVETHIKLVFYFGHAE
jgi:hypothetical protein